MLTCTLVALKNGDGVTLSSSSSSSVGVTAIWCRSEGHTGWAADASRSPQRMAARARSFIRPAARGARHGHSLVSAKPGRRCVRQPRARRVPHSDGSSGAAERELCAHILPKAPCEMDRRLARCAGHSHSADPGRRSVTSMLHAPTAVSQVRPTRSRCIASRTSDKTCSIANGFSRIGLGSAIEGSSGRRAKPPLIITTRLAWSGLSVPSRA
jgi:hypothetical protein